MKSVVSYWNGSDMKTKITLTGTDGKTHALNREGG